MRAITSSMDVHGVRYTEKRKQIERIRKATEVEKKQAVTPVNEYEKRGMTKEDKERATTMTPQEAFRREIAQTHNMAIYRKLQDKENKKEEKSTEEQETER